MTPSPAAFRYSRYSLPTFLDTICDFPKVKISSLIIFKMRRLFSQRSLS